jgi:DNA-binding NtrC family response regulator
MRSLIVPVRDDSSSQASSVVALGQGVQFLRRTGTPCNRRVCVLRISRYNPEYRGEADTASAWRVLVIGAETNREAVKNTMAQWALETTSCSSVQEARPILSSSGYSLIFCEEQLPDGTYHDLIGFTAKPSKSRFVVMSSTPELDDNYDEAMRVGAFEMIASPCRKSDIQWIVIRAMQEESRRGGNRRRSASHEDSGPEAAAVGTNHGGQQTPEGGK